MTWQTVLEALVLTIIFGGCACALGVVLGRILRRLDALEKTIRNK